MSDIGLPLLVAIFVWWLSTGVILYLDGLGRASFRWSMAGATALSAAALGGLYVTSTWETASGAYIAFLCALMVWGWNEMAFLMGYLSGPRRTPCPPDSTGLKRFQHASETIIDHEIGILASGVLIGILTWGAPNQFGLWTFAILWIMRLSTKINIFLGAPNIPDEFLPAHLSYLASYFRRRPMNGFFPFAITAATLFTAFLVHMALGAHASTFERVGYMLLTTLMALAVLEHWLLYVPISATKLWAWGFKSHQRLSAGTGDAQTGSDTASRIPISLISWSADLYRPCDPAEISRVLNAVITGDFGHVMRLDGTAQVDDGWLRFAVADGRASLDKIAPLSASQARVTAVGPSLNRERLQAAFAACAS
jgi:putative photosynthetic complex assembly protein 2